MEKIFVIYLGFLLIKAVVMILPVIVKNIVFNIIPRQKYTAEEVIRCKHQKPDLFYRKQLESNISKKSKAKTYKLQAKEIEVSVIREKFKRKMKNRQLTRCQIIAIRRYLESIVDCKEKKFSNDCHCIYYCLKRLPSKQMYMTALLNFLD